jgi:transcriptional regulator with XRE-family HTH domain
LRALREARGLSQGELARRSKVDRGYLSRVENGLQRPGLGFLHRVAPELGLEDLETALGVVGRFR